jgi:hypothetical protein
MHKGKMSVRQESFLNAFKIGSQVQIALSIKGQADPLTVTAQVARV